MRLTMTFLLLMTLAGGAAHAAALSSSELRPWLDAGFAADDARLWEGAGFRPDEALEWRGFVTTYRHAGRNNLEESLIWIGWGYTPSMAHTFMGDFGGTFREAEDLAAQGLSGGEVIAELTGGGRRLEQAPAPMPDPTPAPVVTRGSDKGSARWRNPDAHGQQPPGGMHSPVP